MPSTYVSLHYHIVFSTKHRAACIGPAWRSELHQYLGGTVRGLGAFPEVVGGVGDHVHLLVSLTATHCLAEFMRELKKGSTAWVREQGHSTGFLWQEGYAAISVSPPSRRQVIRYIERQEEHHRYKTFKEELIAFLDRAGVSYDPRYLD
jgi:putative transposase